MTDPVSLAYLAPIRLPSEKVHTKQIVKTCEALSKQAGVRVELFVSRLHGRREEIWHTYGVHHKFALHHIPALPTVGWGRVGYLLHALSFAVRAYYLARKAKPDVFYTRDWLVALFLRLVRVRYILEVHELKKHILARVALQGANGIVAITQSLAVEMRKMLPHTPIIVAHDAVDYAEFGYAGKARRQPTSSPFVVRYIGSVGLYDWKGVHYLIEAARLLDPARFRVEIVGCAPEWIQRHQDAVPSSVVLRGRVPYRAVPELLATSHALVIPNDPTHPHGARFTSPVKLFEYMAAGRPIVASDVPAIREVLPDDAAFYVDVRDSKAFARKIEEACTTPEALQRAHKAREIAKQCYTWDARAAQIAQFITNL